MRYVKTKGVNPPEAWLIRANELTAQLANLSPRDRARFIKKNEIWSELKEWLFTISHGKCWYSEVKCLGSPFTIDHFRPKNRAKNIDRTEREGYWWLTYNWNNYRISCETCNTRKSIYFPLKENTTSAVGPECNLADEDIYFLDPTVANDTSLITFDDDGNSVPTGVEGTDENKRAKITIKFLGLNEPKFNDRRRVIWKDCRDMINEIQQMMKIIKYITNDGEKHDFSITIEAKIKKLKQMAEKESELSSTAIASLRSSGIPWAMKLASS